jgi:hypothetical protein
MGAGNEKKTFDDVPSGSIRRFPRSDLDYGAFLADLEAKRAVLDQAIASVRAVMSGGALAVNVGDAMSGIADNVAVSLHGGEIPQGAFLGKSIPEAAKLCLQISKKKMTTREIAEALKKGGIETTAKTSFPAIVHSILMRTARAGAGIMKLDRSHWGLAEWYPASMRAPAPIKRVGAKRRQKSGGRKSKATTNEAVAAQEKVALPIAAKPTVPEKIWEAIRNKEMSPTEVAGELGIRANVAAMLLAGLLSKKWAEKTTGGKYRAINAA